MKKKIITIGIILLVLGLISLVIYKKNLIEPASKKDENVVFEVKNGQGVREITNELKKNGLIKNPTTFIIFLKVSGMSSEIKAGVYNLKMNMNILKIADILTDGKVATSKITILEGWQIKDITDYLNKKGIQDKEKISEAFLLKYNYDFLKDKPEEASLEGFLFPDTYFLSTNPTAEQIVDSMLKNFDKKFDQSFRDETKKQGKTIFEVITMASIIEKEVSKEEDRAIVSGIFYKRLELGMPLESDATINFVTGKNNPMPTSEDLKVVSPYNTYKNKGLPFGPVSNPGLSAIKAALYPKESPFLYYLNRQDTKETIFSRTFEEHLENQRKYLR